MNANTLFPTILVSTIASFHVARGDIQSFSPEDVKDFWAQEIETMSRTRTTPRLYGGNEEKGNRIFESFGTNYLPKAYAAYGKLREAAVEKERLLQTNFPNGRDSDVTGGELYQKVIKATQNAIAEMFRLHDEIAVLFILHETGAVTDQRLSECDEATISTILPDESKLPMWDVEELPDFTQDQKSFAAEYLPEALAGFIRLENLFNEGERRYFKLFMIARDIDASRSGSIFDGIQARLLAIRDKLAEIVTDVSKKKLLFSVGETSVSQMAECDKKWATQLHEFEDNLTVEKFASGGLSHGIRWSKNPVMVAKRIIEDMVHIPGGVREEDGRSWYVPDFLIGKFEVTELQWDVVMGKYGRFHKYDDGEGNLPVNEVFKDDCKEFIEKLNAMPVVKRSGLKFRIPRGDEMEYARCGGEKANGTDHSGFSLDGHALSRVDLENFGWVESNSNLRRHPVGQKQPTYFGLYDIFGNVGELSFGVDYDGKTTFGYGGCSYSESGYEGWSDHFTWKKGLFGFRLCADNELMEETKNKEATIEGLSWIGETKIISLSSDISIKLREVPGGLWFGTTEVTQALWDLVMGTESQHPQNIKTLAGYDLPAVNVSYNGDCELFFSKLNAHPSVKKSGLTFRLPTDAEWVLACKAGSSGDYCRLANGIEISEETLREVAWFKDNSGGHLRRVREKKPNAFGLYDMYGNVAEWTVSKIGGVLRGGSIGYSASECSAASGYKRLPRSRSNEFGFRICANKK